MSISTISDYFKNFENYMNNFLNGVTWIWEEKMYGVSIRKFNETWVQMGWNEKIRKRFFTTQYCWEWLPNQHVNNSFPNLLCKMYVGEGRGRGRFKSLMNYFLVEFSRTIAHIKKITLWRIYVWTIRFEPPFPHFAEWVKKWISFRPFCVSMV